MYTGLTGKVMIGTETIAYISNWSVDMSRDVIEMTQMGSSAKIKRPSTRDWSASADGTVVFGTVVGAGVNHRTLFNAMNAENPVPINCQFFLNNETFLSGDGFIESLSIDLSAEDKGNISISIAGTGNLQLTAATEPATPST